MAVRVSKDVFEEKVIKNSKLTVVDFYSDSCVACKRLAPVLGDLEDNYEDKLEVVKVNTNFDPELSEKYEVQANPTLIIIKEGEEVGRRVGAGSYKDIEGFVAQYL